MALFTDAKHPPLLQRTQSKLLSRPVPRTAAAPVPPVAQSAGAMVKEPSSPPSPSSPSWLPDGFKAATAKLSPMQLLEVAERYAAMVGLDSTGRPSFRPQRKYQQFNGQSTATSTASAFTGVAINSIAPGDGLNQRLGRQVRIIHVQLRYLITWSLTGGAATTQASTIFQPFRVTLVKDKMCLATNRWAQVNWPPVDGNSVMFVPVAIITNSTATPNPSAKSRFHLMHDKVYFPSAGTQIASGSAANNQFIAGQKHLDINIPCDFVTTWYDDANGGSILENQLDVYEVTDAAPVASALLPTYDYVHTVTFVDS